MPNVPVFHTVYPHVPKTLPGEPGKIEFGVMEQLVQFEEVTPILPAIVPPAVEPAVEPAEEPAAEPTNMED